MRKFIVSSMLGLGLIAFGASDAKAAPSNPFCFDFTNFCDCLTVSIVPDSAGGNIRRFVDVWENQDCAGTTSSLQGINADGRNNNAGELNAIFGLAGCNFNFTWVGTNAPGSTGVFDLDSPCFGKVQDDSPYSVVAGACPADCSAALKGAKPASTER